MRIFKSVDSKLKEIGFNKIREDKHGAEYEREVNEYGYIQKLSFCHKKSGRHLMASYEKSCNNYGFNNGVGLTAYETKLALKKMKQLGLYSK